MWFDGEGYDWMLYTPMVINTILIIAVVVIAFKLINRYVDKKIDKAVASIKEVVEKQCISQNQGNQEEQ